MDLKLYSYYRSSCSYRVRIALAYKNIDYEYLPVHLVNDGGEQHHEPYKKVNPKSEVPTLIHKNFKLNQSVAIIEYLDELYPAKKLYPQEIHLRALVRQACEIINSGVQPFQNLSLLQKMKKDFSWSEDEKINWLHDCMRRGFIAYESLISSFGEPYSFGNELTAAELFLIPQVYNAHRFDMDMSDFTRINEIDAYCNELDFIIKAHPAHQPDTPKES